MAVNRVHPRYEELLPKWQRCRDVVSGSDAVKDAGDDYLPYLRDQSDDDYDAYKLRAEFFNATARTIGGFVGMMFRKPPKLELPFEKDDDLFTDVTMDGLSLSMLLQDTSWELMTVGRIGWFVDFPVVDEPKTQAQAEAENLRPKIVKRLAEQIINWAQQRINNKTILSRVVLEEDNVSPDPDDEFGEVVTKQYRVLDIEPATGYYRQRVFEVDSENGKDKDRLVAGPFYPKRNNEFLDHIPFYIFGPTSMGPEPEEPPLIDLVDENLSHYRTSADYEHGCHFCGVPTPVVTGHSIVNDPVTGLPTERLYVGGSKAWVFPDPNARAEYLEFTGQGLDALRLNLVAKEGRMAVLGARMLESQKKSAEAAETEGIRRAGENATLQSVAQTIGEGATPALKEYCDWAGLPSEDVEVDINKNFVPRPMSSDQLNAQVNAWQRGAISKEQLFKNLIEGEVISDDADFEEEEDKIENDPSRIPPAPEGAPPTGRQKQNGPPAARR